MNMIKEKGGPRPPIPQYSSEDFVGLHDEKSGQDRHIPQTDWRKLPDGEEFVFEVIRDRYWFRALLAEGDATEWHGPFDSLTAARADFIATYSKGEKKCT